jgi:hypothetical protein
MVCCDSRNDLRKNIKDRISDIYDYHYQSLNNQFDIKTSDITDSDICNITQDFSEKLLKNNILETESVIRSYGNINDNEKENNYYIQNNYNPVDVEDIIKEKEGIFYLMIPKGDIDSEPVISSMITWNIKRNGLEYLSQIPGKYFFVKDVFMKEYARKHIKGGMPVIIKMSDTLKRTI